MNAHPLKHFPEGSGAYIEHPAHAKPGIHPFPDKLYVVTMVSNPLRWRSRYQNYHNFERQIEAGGAVLYTAEVAFGGRQFEVTQPDNPHHLQLRSHDELWYKENAQNLMVQRLPAEAQYIAFIDADAMFARQDWAQETLHLLQHYDVIQMFSTVQDLNANYEPMGVRQRDKNLFARDTLMFPGFIAEWFAKQNEPHRPGGHDPIPFKAAYGPGGYAKGFWGQPGLAWAWRRSSLAKVGMLIDWAIMGSADWHMATALIGHVESSIAEHTDHLTIYNSMVRNWAKLCADHIKKNVGFMPGHVFHFYHGSKNKRGYATRWSFLDRIRFDPAHDLKRDHQGLWQLIGATDQRTIELRDGIRAIMRARDEDAT
jgi:hypothetical protein